MNKSIFLIVNFVIIVSSTNYIQCGENIISILPKLKEFTNNVHLNNLYDIGEGLSYLKTISSTIAENCGINQALFDAYKFVKFMEVNSTNCSYDIRIISEYASEIIKKSDDIISDIDFLEKILMALPKTLKNCEMLIPDELIENEEILYWKEEEEMDISLEDELFVGNKAGEFSKTEIELQIDYNITLVDDEIIDFTNHFQTFLQEKF